MRLRAPGAFDSRLQPERGATPLLNCRAAFCTMSCAPPHGLVLLCGLEEEPVAAVVATERGFSRTEHGENP